LPEIVELLSDGIAQPRADSLDRRILPLGLSLAPLALLEERHVAGLRLDQVVGQDHLERLADVHRLLELAVRQKRHQRHLPAVLRDALLTAVREPAVTQLALQPLREGEEVEDGSHVGHEIVSPKMPAGTPAIAQARREPKVGQQRRQCPRSGPGLAGASWRTYLLHAAQPAVPAQARP
jgi:hypothetical protein